MGWIRTDLNWSIPTIRVVITKRASEVFIHPRFIELCTALQNRDPEIVASLVQPMLCANGAIQDAIVIGMNFLFDECALSFVLAHKSFPRLQEYEKLPIAYLAENENHEWVLISDDPRIQSIITASRTGA